MKYKIDNSGKSVTYKIKPMKSKSDKYIDWLAKQSDPKPKPKVKKEKSSEAKVMAKIMKELRPTFEYRGPIKGQAKFFEGYHQALRVIAWKLVEIEYKMLNKKP